MVFQSIDLPSAIINPIWQQVCFWCYLADENPHKIFARACIKFYVYFDLVFLILKIDIYMYTHIYKVGAYMYITLI